METSPLNSKGFTLVEVLFAVVILMVGLLGLLQSVNVATDQNMRNQLRDGAVRVAERTMGDMKLIPFAAISAPYPVLSSAMNGISAKKYLIIRSTTRLTDDTRELAVRVTWRYKGEANQHGIHSLKSK